MAVKKYIPRDQCNEPGQEHCGENHVKPKRVPMTEFEKQAKKFERRAKKYGMTVEQLRLLEAKPCCDICARVPLPGKSLYTDHDHKTGRVRGRLCFTCNYRLLGKGALGRADIHRKAAEYLESTFDGRKALIPG